MQRVVKDPTTNRRYQHPKIDRNIDPLPGEIWKDITEWKGHELREGYQVSNLGRVRNLGRTLLQRGVNGRLVYHTYPACMLRQGNDSDGYKQVLLCTTGTKRTIDCRVHQLVATYFLDVKPRPDQTHVNHIDGDKTNNTPENLEWASPSENNKHARDTGLARLGTSQAKRCKFIEWDTIFSSKTQASLATGHKGGYINDCERLGTQMKDARTGQLLHLIYIAQEDNDE